MSSHFAINPAVFNTLAQHHNNDSHEGVTSAFGDTGSSSPIHHQEQAIPAPGDRATALECASERFHTGTTGESYFDAGGLGRSASAASDLPISASPWTRPFYYQTPRKSPFGRTAKQEKVTFDDTVTEIPWSEDALHAARDAAVAANADSARESIASVSFTPRRHPMGAEPQDAELQPLASEPQGQDEPDLIFWAHPEVFKGAGPGGMWSIRYTGGQSDRADSCC